MMRNIKKLDYYIMMLIIIPFIFPAGLVFSSVFEVISKVKYISLVVVILYTFNKGRLIRNKLVFSFFLFSFEILLVTIIKGGYVDQALKLVVEIIIPLLWAEYMFSKYEQFTLNTLFIYFVILSLLNFGFEITMPSGFVPGTNNPVNLIGDDNKMVFFLLPGMALSICHIMKFSNKKTYKFYLFIVIFVFIISELYVWAVTGMVTMLIVIYAWYITENNIFLKKFFNQKIGLGFILLLNFIIIFKSDIFSTGILGLIITNIFGKTVTFSGRLTLWTQAVNLISSSPVIGHGIGEFTEYAFLFHTREGVLKGFSPHNGYLLLALRGGILGLTLYFLSIVNLLKVAKTKWNSRVEVRILYFTILGFLIACIFESEFYSFPFLLVCGYLYTFRDRRGNMIHTLKLN